MCDTPVTGKIFKVWPGLIESLVRSLAHLIVSTEMPNFLAIEDKVSPFWTV